VLTPLPASRWNEKTATHLLNRAAFGGTPAEIEKIRRKGLALAVRDLVDFEPAAAEVPPPTWAHPKDLKSLRMAARAADNAADKKEKKRELRMMEGQEIVDLRRWWLDRMINGPAPLLEKMTLFWHGHFATSIDKVKDAYWMWLQNDTFRRNAFGSFAALTKKMSRDPAMMIYLDLEKSRPEHPNENWAREVMELFTVGIGNYTEQDIRESARAFTGYRVDMTTQQYRFAAFQQDRGNKTFMGQTGPLDGDQVLDVIVRQPACARFIGRKLWRFFVEDEPSNQMVDAVAASLRKHNLEIRPVLREIFSSAEFYDERVMDAQIKSPVQFLVQTAKLLESPLPDPTVAQNALRQMGQTLFAPPNVKGWDGGKSWITTSTLLFRYNFANYLVNGDSMFPGNTPPRPQGKGVGFSRAAAPEPVRRDPIDVAKVIPTDLRDKPKELIDFLSDRLFQTRASDKMASTFAQYLEAKKPDTSDQTMRGLLHLMMSTPQFQLA
jgi:uncharacterized protein (DUF1800 family)